VLLLAAEFEPAQILEEEIIEQKSNLGRAVWGQPSRLLLPVLCHSQKRGGFHPILDLHNLNKHLRKYMFKMLTLKIYNLFILKTVLHQSIWRMHVFT